MKIYEEKVENLFPLEELTKDDKNNLFCSKHHFYQFVKKNQIIYHMRKDKVNYILNEIIGELVSEYFELKTVKGELYKIDKDDNFKYCLLTKLFTNSNDKYGNIYDLFPNYYFNYNDLKIINNLSQIYDPELKKKYTLKKQFRIDIIKKLKRMIIRDFVTNTTDRHFANFMFSYDKSFIELMPLYDYEYSFRNGRRGGNLFDFNIESKEVINFLRNDDTFQEILEKAMELKMSDIFKKLHEQYPIKLNGIDKNKYESVVIRNQRDIKKYKLIR